MTPFSKIFLPVSFFAANLLLVHGASALTCNDQADGNWNSAGTWSCGAIPGSGDTVTIDSHTVTLTQAQSAASVTMSGGTFNMASYTLTDSGSWTYTSGTLNAGTGTVKFTGTSTFTPGGANYYNVEYGGNNPTFTLSGTATILNNFTISASSTISMTGGTMNVGGNISCTGAVGAQATATTVIVLNGSGAQAVSSSGGGAFPGITVNKSGGTVTLSGTIPITGSWTYSAAGALDPGTSTLKFLYSGTTFTPGSVSYYNVEYSGNNPTYTLSGTATILNNFTMSTASTLTMNGGTLDVQGNVVQTGSSASGGGTTVIQLSGTKNQTMSMVSGFYFTNVTINKSGGTVTLGSDINIRGSWVWSGSGLLNAGTRTLVFASNSASFTPGSVDYYNLEFDSISGGSAYTLSGNPTVKNNLLFATAGGSSFTINGGTFNVYGNVSNTHTSPVYGTYAINIVGANNQTISQSSSSWFTSVTVNKTAGVLTVSGTVTISNSWTYTAGKVNFGTSTLQFTKDTGSVAFVPGNVTYYNVEFATYPGGTTLNVNGNLKLSNLFNLTGTNSGTVNTNGYAITTKDFTFNASSTTFNAGSSILKISGNFTRTAGTFSAGTSTVILNGTNQSITGATTFYNLYKMLPAGTTDTLTFGASTTYTIASGGTARFIGSRDGLLSLRSSSSGTAYTLTKTGSIVAEYVDMQDCTVSAATTASASINTSGNTSWTFTREFVSKIRASGGDYTTLSGWESAVQSDLTTSKVFSHGGITGTIPDNTAVTGFTSGATGTAVHATSTQILIKTITGTFQSGEQIRVDASNYVTTSDAGNTAIAVAEVYNDWSASGLNDSVTLSGWTTGSNYNYILIVAPQGQRHQGLLKDPATGWYRGFTLRPSSSTSYGIDNQQSYTRLEGLAVDGANIITANIRLNNRPKGHKLLSANGVNGFSLEGAGLYLTNSLAYGATGNCFMDTDGLTVGYTVYNSTARECAYGFQGDNVTSSITLKNVLASGNTTADFSLTNTGAKSVTYSASSDATADDLPTTTGDRVSQTFSFMDVAGKDFRLGSKDAGARDFGTDLSSDATYPIIDDIEYESRPAVDPYNMNSAVWDIGADEMNPDTPRIKDGVRLKAGTRLR